MPLHLKSGIQCRGFERPVWSGISFRRESPSIWVLESMRNL